ncbi:hypothetical protein DFQ28_000773 [Apophysomyces sp. BC1034]|nr:hypothetical protein DFQ30_006662 [Apophysomyces sp. BC1015]KAG0183241.1 hypothetical protein DFQ29_008601 [Apophysomyces sp. BC1021]KAG0191170.1 hypothetical protein DFQ28_000773 [Apophysomyces sp. BC1034]
MTSSSDQFTSVTMVNEATPLIQTTLAPPPRRKEILGLFLMALSALGFSTMSLFVKIGAASFPSFEMVFARSVVQLFFGLAGCAVLNVNPLGRTEVRKWLVFRGLVGSIGLALFFYSITQLPLADATVVFFLGPTFTAILAAAILGEAFTLFDGVCSILCMAGVVLVSKPQFLFGDGGHGGPSNGLQRLIAIAAALVGAMMSAVAYVTVRKIGKGAHFMVHVVYFGLMSTLISFFGMFAFQEVVKPSGWHDYFILLLVGLCAYIGQCLLNLGLQLAPAGPGTLMRMNDVVFAFLFGIFILHEYPDSFSILGACLIVGMTTALGLHKWYSASN